MEKALEILKKEYQLICDMSFEWGWKSCEESMKPKTCEGCKYAMYGVDSLGIEFDCGIDFRCTRGQKDRYEKDTQC